MKLWQVLLTISIILLVGISSALTLTPPTATMIGTNNVTLTETGASGTYGWFLYGTHAGASWAHLPNQTINAGSFSYYWKGSPLWNGTNWYVRGCDQTGCSAEIMFVIPAPTPLPIGNLGATMQNISENRFDAMNIIWNSAQPYIAVTGATIFYGAIYSMIILGLFFRTRSTGMGTMLTMILGGLFFSSAVGLGLGVPPELSAILQAVMYISLAGTILSWLFK
jgi:uncharacterized membrane protein